MTHCKSLDQVIKIYAENHENVDFSRTYKERVKEYELWKKLVR